MVEHSAPDGVRGPRFATAIGCRGITRARVLPAAHPGEPRFYVAEQLSQLWRVSVMSVYRQVHDNCLPAIRIGSPDKGRLIIPAQAVDSTGSAGSDELAPPYHRLASAARFCGVSYGHLHREIQGGRFPGVRIRSVWLVPTAAIEGMVQAALDCNGEILASEFGDWAPNETPDDGLPPSPAPPPTGRIRPTLP